MLRRSSLLLAGLSLLLVSLSCGPRPHMPDGSLAKRLETEGGWTPAAAIPFCGDSVSLALLDFEGEVLHVWVDGQCDASGRRFWLKRSYYDEAAEEVLPQSEPERRLIHLLEHQLLRASHPQVREVADNIKTALSNRSLPLRIIPFTPLPEAPVARVAPE